MLMISKKRILILVSIIIISMVLTSLLSGCGGTSPGAVPTPTPTPLIGVGPHQPDVPELSCPDEKTLYSLWFSHLAELNIDVGEGNTVSLRFENIPPSLFDLWIESDGQISNEGIFREAQISYNGTATHPNSANCPVQTFEGVWNMRAKISGTCTNDVARIHIIEEWVNPKLESDCVSSNKVGAGVYSAPELDLVFDLNDAYPSDSIKNLDDLFLQVDYAYHLYPAGYELPIVPLVPEE